MNKYLIFNPFVKIAGTKSLIIGLVVMLIAGFTGFYSKTHFDGILNVHAGSQAPMYIHLAGPFISVFTVALWFAIFSLFFAKPNVRYVDIIGTQCFAFIPLMPASFLGFFEIMDTASKKIQEYAANPSQPIIIEPFTILIFVILITFVMLLSVLSAILIYNGFKVASNLPNKVHIPVYISGLVIGMVIPKLLLIAMQ